MCNNRPKASGKVCHYCRKTGHVISDCWTLKRKKESDSSSPSLLVSSLNDDSFSYSTNVNVPESLVKQSDSVREDYLPFVSEGSVSLNEN